CHSSRRASMSSWAISASVSARTLSMSIAGALTLYETDGHGQLVAGQAHRLHGLLAGYAAHLEQDAARLDHRDPMVRGALARAHARLGRLLRDRLVREHPDPDLAAPFDRSGHRAPGGLDLPAGGSG